ncbi:DUF3048 domain-containing protein [Peribacillus alkalitolerans]|uniref:DUF3048 domain-containing protein n=1 Tax=Peribacillus alkalitolerans TaxID=1550385 RepID=UPI0013D892FE|nr:DUF3048 domain-containing protein [Peribacillus alkalitolerans]
MRLRTLTVSLLTVSLLAVGCSKKEEATPKKEPTKQAEPVQAQETKEESDVMKYAFPLSGVGTNEVSNQRAVAVMVNNHPKARPQSGISQADIVYEMLAEGEVTRFLAVFQSEKPDRIGPVRSARDYYIELAKGLNGIYICHGYSPEAKAMLDSGFIENLNGIVYDGTLFKRDKTRKAPHNSYITFENIEKGAEKNGFNMEQAPGSFPFLTEDEMEVLNGEKGEAVSISYGTESFNVRYEFDKATSTYNRFSKGEQTIDKETGKPVQLKNVFIIEAQHKIVDKHGRRDINLESGGNAYLLQDGKWNAVQWENKNGLLIPVKDGKEVGFIPGKTWVNIIPQSPGLAGSVSFSEGI